MSVTVTGKQIPKPFSAVRPNISRGSKRNPYRTKSYCSEVDETLFGSPARYGDQRDTPRVQPEDVDWNPPWVTSPTKTGVPLLWSPYDDKSPTADSNNDPPIRMGKKITPRTPTSARNKYRVRRSVPSYVDETLFGTPPKEPDFPPPWDTDENVPDQRSCQVGWSPPLVPSKTGTPLGSARVQSNQMTNGGRAISRDFPLPRTPVIKARPGSAIKTPSRGSQKNSYASTRATPVPKAQQKLNFDRNGVGYEEENVDHDPDAIIERALRMAGIQSRRGDSPRYRSNSLGSVPLSQRSPSPGGYFWRRPSTTSSIGKPDTPASRKQTPVPDKSPELEVEEMFLASGRQMTLSARSTPTTPRSRPNSARSGQTLGSVPGLDLSQPPRSNYHLKRPSSARTTTSSRLQSPLSSRPSWRP